MPKKKEQEKNLFLYGWNSKLLISMSFLAELIDRIKVLLSVKLSHPLMSLIGLEVHIFNGQLIIWNLAKH